jgi:hypothetical protein
MKRFVESMDRGKRYCFPNAWKTGSTRTTRFGRSMSLLMSLIFPSWDSMGALLGQLADLHIIPRGC